MSEQVANPGLIQSEVAHVTEFKLLLFLWYVNVVIAVKLPFFLL